MADLTKQEFENCFCVIENNADGNCLFEAIEYLLIGSLYELENGKTTASDIRTMVGNFYRDFDKDIDYPESTIEYKIKIGNLFDNMDDGGIPHDYNMSPELRSSAIYLDTPDYHLDHSRNIWNDRVWASMTDVLICSLLFEININLYKYNSNTNMYNIEKITSQYNFINTVNLLYNGVNHFEACEMRASRI